jgi:hypothetical protein
MVRRAVIGISSLISTARATYQNGFTSFDINIIQDPKFALQRALGVITKASVACFSRCRRLDVDVTMHVDSRRDLTFRDLC